MHDIRSQLLRLAAGTTIAVACAAMTARASDGDAALPLPASATAAPGTPPAPTPSAPTPSAPTPSAPTPSAPTPSAPTPAPLAPGAGRPVVPLALKDAIVRSLANNPDLEIDRLSVKYARVGPDVPDGAFDPVFFLSATLGENRSPFFSSNPFSGLAPGLVANPTESNSLGAGMRFRSTFGTAAEVRYDVARRSSANIFALSPSYSPAATVSVTQSLLKGLSPTYQTAAIVIARNDARISEEAFRDRVLTLALQVEEAYWTYVFTRENLKVAELALASARQLLSINQQKFKVGNVPEIDVLIAESGVASRGEAVIVARNDILNARDNLFRLILPQGAGHALAGEDGALEARRATAAAWDVDLLPLDAPRADEAAVDVEKALTTAFDHRPDYQQLAIALRSSDLNVDRSWNELLPRLDATGTYSRLGLGKSWGNAAKTQVDDNFDDWQIGFNFEVPIFNTTPRAQYAQAELSLAQARKRIESIEQTILLDVRTAARNLDAALERVRATDVAARLADRQLDNETKRLEAGLSTSYDVQLSVQNQSTARTNFLKANVDREVARARLERATATILEGHGIRFELP